MKYAWIQEHRCFWALECLCRALKVSVSGYYSWLKRQSEPSAQAQRRQRLKQAISQSHQASRQSYGYRRIRGDIVAMTDQDLPHHPETIRNAMREMGLRSKRTRRFVVTTDSAHGRPVAPNRLGQDFVASAPNQKWVSDITYIATGEGWLYLVVYLDLFSRRVVGWSMSQRIDAALVVAGLTMALAQRSPAPGLLLHSDRGSQYTSDAYQERLEQGKILPSMSRKGNCWDNACAESFFASLKTEWLKDKIYPTRAEAKNDLFFYIESFYNRQRRHSYLGDMSPASFEAFCSAKINRAAI